MSSRIEKIKNRSYLHLFPILHLKEQDDETISKKAIKLHSYHFAYTSKRLRDKKEFCMFGLKQSFYNFKHISTRLKKDYDLIDYYLSNNIYGFKELDIEFYSRDYKVLSMILSKSLNFFNRYPYHFLKKIINIYENKLSYTYLFENIIIKKNLFIL